MQPLVITTPYAAPCHHHILYLHPDPVLRRRSCRCCAARLHQVSDFGLARRLTEARSHRTTSTAGTLNHTAPELLRLGKLSPAADVYAFGIMSEWLQGADGSGRGLRGRA
jgi:hypothetical protein